jgi:hypothetical protein
MYATPIPCPLIHSAFKLLWEGATFVVLLFFLGHVIDFLLLFNIMNCINLLFISLKLIFTSVFFSVVYFLFYLTPSCYTTLSSPWRYECSFILVDKQNIVLNLSDSPSHVTRLLSSCL